jgi:subtilisin-like proprotein convertase family protein
VEKEMRRRSHQITTPVPCRRVLRAGRARVEALEPRALLSAPIGSISGTVFFDTDADGVRGPSDRPAPGPSVFIDSNLDALYSGGSTSTSDWSLPLPVPDGATTVYDIPVAGRAGLLTDSLAPTYGVVEVTLRISHPHATDLTVTLVSPQGTRLELFRNVGGDGANFIDTKLYDYAATPIGDGIAPFTGSFRPVSPLNALVGEIPNGIWRLEVRDEPGNGSGTLENWGMSLHYGETGTWADADGNYTLPVYHPGTHTVRQWLPNGYVGTAPAENKHVVTVADGEHVVGRDFGRHYGSLPSSVVARHVYYNESSYDRFTAGAAASDDAAIATDKSVLLPGQGPATFANVTTYDKGINGLMLDMRQLPGSGSLLRPMDFSVRTRSAANAGDWSPGPSPSQVAVRRAAGAGGSDRVTLVWYGRNAAVRPEWRAPSNGWIEVTVAANDNTGLQRPDVFYIGNLIGDTGGGIAAPARVDVIDLARVRAHVGAWVQVNSPYDFDRDGRVTAADLLTSRRQLGSNLALPGAGFATPSSDPALSLQPTGRSEPVRRVALDVLIG